MILRAIIAAIVWAVLSTAALAERRVALVFGADDYRAIRPLENAVNDARAVEDALAALDFEVFSETNRDLRRMRRALDDFVEDAEGADVALVFFAGHGVEIGGENRLLPVDADAASLDRLKETSLPLDEVRAAVAAVARIGLVVLDACRNDPFGAMAAGDGRGAKSLAPDVQTEVKPGLGRMGRAENVLFAFSAAPGETAADGAGGNSPFTAALTKYLPTDGLEIRSVLTLVQQEVYDFSGGTQLPYVESGLPQTFFAAQTGDLPERERLLLAMADVTPALRDELERVAAAHDVPLAPLYGALIENRLGELSNEDRATRLAEAAQAFAYTRDKLRTFSSADPEVGRLRAEAEQNLALGAFEKATDNLDRAIEVDRKAGDAVGAVFVERTLSQAASLTAKAGVARTELRREAAIAALEEAAALHASIEALEQPDEARRTRDWLLQDIGELNLIVGNTAAGLSAFERMRDAARLRMDRSADSPDAARDLSVSQNRIGDVRRVQGDRTGAIEAYGESLAIAERFAALHPGDPSWQFDLGISHERIGDTHAIRGDLAAALRSYEARHAIISGLVQRDPDNAEWQRDLAISHNKVADVRFDMGDRTGAIAAYRASLDIRSRLAARDPGNDQWQRDLSVSHERIGNVFRRQGDVDAALASFQASLDIRARLARRDPGNTAWQRDLAVSHEKVGDARRAGDDLTAALESYERSLAIVRALAARDPGNAEWQRDLSVSFGKIGNVLREKGDLDGAMTAYAADLAIARDLVARDPINTEWQRDLSVSLDRIGDIHREGGDLKDALEHYEEALAIAEHLAATDPANTGWQGDLFVSLNKVGDLQRAEGRRAEALRAYRAALPIAERMAADDPAGQRRVVIAHVRIVQAGGDARTHLTRALAIATEMERSGVLAPSDAELPSLLRAELAKL